MSDTPNGNDTPSAAAFQPAHTRTLSSSHTRTLSSSHVIPNVHQLQTAALAAHTQQLTSIPPDLPQLTVTTPTTIYSAYTTQSTTSSFGTNGGGGSPFSPPTHVPDVPVPAVPEQYRRQAAIDDVATAPSPPQSPPALIITNATPPPSQARFASPMTANPNAPVLPRLATPGSAVTPSNVARKPIPAIITSPPTDGDAVARVKAGARSYSPPMRNSPGAGGKTWSPPAKPYAAGSMSTMSPVAAARSFNNRAAATAAKMHPYHVKHDSNASDTIDSPTVATTRMYAATKGRDKADISTADRVVGRETLFDLDVDVDEEKGTADARELPLADLMGDELPEYIQVYLTPHPDREGMGAKGAFGAGDDKDEKAMLGAGILGDDKTVLSSKEKDAMASEDKEYERRAAKWNDIEATLPAYKSTPSLHRAAGFGREEPAKGASAPKRRRCVPAKTSTRILCLVILFMALLVVPLVTFGVVYSLQLKGKHDNGQGTAQEVPAAGNDTSNPLATFDAPPPQSNVPPIVAPMTTPAAGEPLRTAAENQIAIGQGGGGGGDGN